MSTSSDRPLFTVKITCNAESNQRHCFNYIIKIFYWDFYGECEGILLQKLVGQIQSVLFKNWGCPSRDNMTIKVFSYVFTQ